MPSAPHWDPSALRRHLLALEARSDRVASLARDPIAFPRRYTDPLDQELAGLIAAGLAYGRVDLFRPVIAALLDRADAHGGPRAYVETFDAQRETPHLRGLVYRFNRHPDFTLLFGGLRRVLEAHGSLGALFAAGVSPRHPTITGALTTFVDVVRAAVQAEAGGVALTELPRGVRYLLPSPRQGSACKRLNLYLRWMIRPADGVDLGCWAVEPARLVIPLDVHVHRVSRFLGLTARKDASWRTALEVTARLRELDSDDPVRFDFALAHLGISGDCQGRRVVEILSILPPRPALPGRFRGVVGVSVTLAGV